MTLDETTSTSNSTFITLRRLVWIGAILNVIGFLVTPTVFLQAMRFHMIGHAISTIWSLFILWNIAHLKNWARRWFIVGGLVIFPAVVPLTPYATAIMKSSLTPLAMTIVCIVYALSILYSIAFAIFLFNPRIRALFTPIPPDRALRVLLGISAVIALGLGIFIGRIISRYVPTSSLNSVTIKASLHPNKNLPYIGFWKQNCQDNYGFAIDGTADGRYSTSLCGPSGCIKTGTDLPSTFLDSDPRYHVIDQNTIQINTAKGISKLSRCEPVEGDSPVKEESANGVALNWSRPDYLKSVAAQINSHWKPASKFSKDTLCQVVFVIEPDGSISSATIEKPSGSTEFDQASLKTVQNAGPFPPMPPDIGAQSLKVHLKFEGKPK